MSMSLFTFIAEYDGGTYIQQLRASSPKAALTKYTKETNWIDRAVLAKSLSNETPIQIEDTVGVYCVSAILKRKLLLLNMVRTEN